MVSIRAVPCNVKRSRVSMSRYLAGQWNASRILHPSPESLRAFTVAAPRGIHTRFPVQASSNGCTHRRLSVYHNFFPFATHRPQCGLPSDAAQAAVRPSACCRTRLTFLSPNAMGTERGRFIHLYTSTTRNPGRIRRPGFLGLWKHPLLKITALNALICGIQGVLLKKKLLLIHRLNPAKAFGRIQVNLARQLLGLSALRSADGCGYRPPAG